MLRNRSRASIMADHQTARNPVSFLASPRFFLPRNMFDAHSSPTSILELFNFAGNPFGLGKNTVKLKPRKIFEGSKHPSQNFDSEGIALALDLIEEKPNGDICETKATASRKVLFGSKLKIQIPSLQPSPNGFPESPGDFGIKTRNPQSTPTGFVSPRVSTGPLSLSEMELSEEYTRVISHGPNPKTTHIYDNCVVEKCCGILNEPGRETPCESILSFCHTCNKNLGEGCDIFMYRGDKAFCSEECRCQEMFLDGLMNP